MSKSDNVKKEICSAEYMMFQKKTFVGWSDHVKKEICRSK